MRRAAALSVVLVLAACSDVDRPPIERVSGSVGGGGYAIKAEAVKLRYDNGSSSSPRRSVLISRNPAALYFSFARSTARPVSWTGTVVIDGGTPQETREDVVLSF